MMELLTVLAAAKKNLAIIFSAKTMKSFLAKTVLMLTALTMGSSVATAAKSSTKKTSPPSVKKEVIDSRISERFKKHQADKKQRDALRAERKKPKTKKVK